MPPKRKSADLTTVNDRVIKSKRLAPKSTGQLDHFLKMKVDSESKSKEEESNTEIIKYDEYFEGGIPDTLLEGLGFSETDTPDKNEEEDSDVELNTVAIPDVRTISSSDSLMTFPYGLMPGGLMPVPMFFPSATALAMMASFNNCATLNQAMQLPMLQAGLAAGLLQSQHLLVNDTTAAGTVQSNTLPNLSTRKDTHDQASLMNPPPNIESTGVKPSVEPSAKPVQTKSTGAAMKSVTSSNGHANKRFVSPNKPMTSPTSSGSTQSASQPTQATTKTQRIMKGNVMYERLPTGEVVASLIKKPGVQGSPSKVDNELKKVQQRVTQSPYVRPNQPTISNLDQCPSDYPVTEHNVMDVLEQSIQATHSMRLLLMSLRDDLRRMGGGSNSTVTVEQVRKRKEVACNLATAYVAYKESINNIENVRFISNARAGDQFKSDYKDKRSAVDYSDSPVVSEQSVALHNASKAVSQKSSPSQSRLLADETTSSSSSDSADVRHEKQFQQPAKDDSTCSVNNLQNSVKDSDGDVCSAQNDCS